jgi:hypothetical protein
VISILFFWNNRGIKNSNTHISPDAVWGAGPRRETSGKNTKKSRFCLGSKALLSEKRSRKTIGWTFLSAGRASDTHWTHCGGERGTLCALVSEAAHTLDCGLHLGSAAPPPRDERQPHLLRSLPPTCKLTVSFLSFPCRLRRLAPPSFADDDWII